MEFVWDLVRPLGNILGLRGAENLITDAKVAVSPARMRRKSEITPEDVRIFETLPPKVAIALMKNSETIWQYLELKDLLVFSTCSRFTANMFISQQCILENFERNDQKLASIGNFKISFASELTLGLLRRLLNRIVNGKKAVVSIDAETGRLQMDIGSAYKQEDTYYAARIDEVEQQKDNDVVLPGIEGVLSAHSVDEYDDFNPKHPTFRANTGSASCFSSSDFEEYARDTYEKTAILSDLEMWSLHNSRVSFGMSSGSMSSFSSASNLRGRSSASTSDGDLSPKRASGANIPNEREYLDAHMRAAAINMDLKVDDDDDNEADDEDEGDEEDEIVASTFEYVIG